jgi:50S ribosomal protein L16 3-hydroxylase
MTVPPMLATIVEPLTIGEFFSSVWPARLGVFRGSPERLPDIDDIAGQGFAELAGHSSGAQAIFDYATPIPASLIDKLYQAGHTIELALTNDVVPSWRYVLPLELGIPVSATSTTLFATPANGRGTRAHWDGWEQFIVQVRGHKEWRLAVNTAVQFPSVPYAQGDLVAPRLSWLCGPTPPVMREPETAIVMEPGTVLFLPRGYWHETKALGEESWHVCVYLRTPTLATALGNALLALQRVEWRTPTRAASGLDRPLAAAVNELHTCLHQAVSDVTGQILLEASRASEQFQWSGDRVRTLEGRRLVISSASDGSTFLAIEMEDHLLSVAEWMVNRVRFGLDELLRLEGSATTRERVGMTNALEKTGALLAFR